MSSSTEPLTQREIDRLVEGELSQPERRQLIARIEEEPEGWRRCGLAFLEAQSWRKSLRLVVARSTERSVAADENRPVFASSRRRMHFLATVVATAVASLLIGIGIGKSWTAEGRSVVDHEPNRAVNKVDPSVSEMSEAQPPNVPVEDEVRFVGYVSYDNDQEGAQTVPIISGPGFNEQWLANQPAPLSEYEISQLEGRGWRVHQERRLIRVQLTDGRTLTVPIDTVAYQFAPPPMF